MRAQARAQGIDDRAQHAVAVRMAVRVVGGLQAVDVEERQDERPILAPRATDLPRELDESRSPLIGPRQRVVRRMLALDGRCPAVGKRRLAVQLGLVAFAGAGPPVGLRDVAVEHGLGPFPGPRPPVGLRDAAVEPGLGALPGPRLAVGVRDAAIELRLGALVGAGAPILRGARAIAGRAAP